MPVLTTQTLHYALLTLGFSVTTPPHYVDQGTLQAQLLDAPRLRLMCSHSGRVHYVAVLSLQHLAQEIDEFRQLPPPTASCVPIARPA